MRVFIVITRFFCKGYPDGDGNKVRAFDTFDAAHEYLKDELYSEADNEAMIDSQLEPMLQDFWDYKNNLGYNDALTGNIKIDEDDDRDWIEFTIKKVDVVSKK